jgi:hypothetical protein
MMIGACPHRQFLQYLDAPERPRQFLRRNAVGASVTGFDIGTTDTPEGAALEPGCPRPRCDQVAIQRLGGFAQFVQRVGTRPVEGD